MDLGKKGERTYCDRGSSGRALWNSGANMLMQRPTVKQRRGSKIRRGSGGVKNGLNGG